MEAGSVGGLSAAEGGEEEVGAKETGRVLGIRARLAAPGAGLFSFSGLELERVPHWKCACSTRTRYPASVGLR